MTGLTQIFGDRPSGRAPTGWNDFSTISASRQTSGATASSRTAWAALILDAFDGERGQNFIGTRQAMLQAAGLKERESARAS